MEVDLLVLNGGLGSWILILTPLYGVFPKLGVPYLRVPTTRIIVYWGLKWGPPILGNYHIVQLLIPISPVAPVSTVTPRPWPREIFRLEDTSKLGRTSTATLAEFEVFFSRARVVVVHVDM